MRDRSRAIQPVGNIPVTFTVASGPDAGTTAQATTGANGQASFTFTGTAAGSDLVRATAGSGKGFGCAGIGAE